MQELRVRNKPKRRNRHSLKLANGEIQVCQHQHISVTNQLQHILIFSRSGSSHVNVEGGGNNITQSELLRLSGLAEVLEHGFGDFLTFSGVNAKHKYQVPCL